MKHKKDTLRKKNGRKLRNKFPFFLNVFEYCSFLRIKES